ncbi:biotin-dependent carboxyltransferase family protein [uncultured Halopseudomonas sp.]|uniref:5-oxoprolinase subunit C family protein n=1 Tax=uncultured Halopseudomonas sp. TaxID=2901193 RepID=UPI0030EF36A5|tara:strand:+ start:81160 stop:82101 length:942 start_codon:yes stop_codon:yes gene_type:complete
MSGLLIERTLGLAQLQDRGRFGTRHIGVTQGGALDWIAAAWANRLLGNAADCAVLEIPFGGVSLQCQQHSTLAITGADLQATLDGHALPNWQSFNVRPGQQLVFATAISGVRGYLSAPGGIDAPLVLNSRSTVRREQLGGLHGNGADLRAGDLLKIGRANPSPTKVPDLHRVTTSSASRLDLILGSQVALFSGASLFAAFNQPWRVDHRADRMGLRLCGPALRYQGPPIISEGIPLGAVQVPADGQPIILLNDRQTIGGYPRLGALTPASVARLAQFAAGETLWLRPIPLDRAIHEHRELLRTIVNTPLVRPD